MTDEQGSKQAKYPIWEAYQAFERTDPDSEWELFEGGYLDGRASLEQDNRHLRELLTLKDDLLRAYRTGDHKLADRTLSKLERAGKSGEVGNG